MRYLELLAPARNLDIGIAAIDCGADAVYIAAEEFGARQDAGNSIDDIAVLCRYAHRFGVRIFVTVNTLVYEDELDKVGTLLQRLAAAGVDALIVQDPAVLVLARERGLNLHMHASTQCSIREPERARFLESLGFSRLVLERELTLQQIRSISDAVQAEIEVFVHGAVCVCYNGQCYLSEALEGRSANRGRCIQACRSLYDLEDGNGRVLERNKALLSLKDMNLLARLEDLAEAGATSFKIEGRLKNRSYVINTVKAYSDALDALCGAHPDRWARSSFGRSEASFVPDLAKTFNRGYTELLLDGRKRGLASMEIARSIGEPVGIVRSVRIQGESMRVDLKTAPGVKLSNGDGFCFVDAGGKAVGFRGDVCEGTTVRTRRVTGLREGTQVYRNLNAAFEKQLRSAKSGRSLSVRAQVTLTDDSLQLLATSEDGREAMLSVALPRETALQPERMARLIGEQLGKKTDIYAFRVTEVRNLRADGSLPLMSTAFLNGIRREAAAHLEALPCRSIPLGKGSENPAPAPEDISYKYNVANSVTEGLYRSRGAVSVEKAFELDHRQDAELMRSKYCIRFELGLCPVHQGAPDSGPLFLVNNGRRFPLGFDCRRCEMVVYNSSSTRSTSPK